MNQTEFYGVMGSYSYLVTRMAGEVAVLVDPTPDCMDAYAASLEKARCRRVITLETGSVPGSRDAVRQARLR